RCGGRCTRRIPHFARRIKDDIAADEHILAWSEGEASRRAKFHRIGVLHRGGIRADAHDASVLHVWTDLRDGEIEPPSAGIPDWVLGTVSGVNPASHIQEDGVQAGEGAGRLIDFYEGAGWGRGRVVYRQNEPILRVVCELIRAGGLAEARGHFADRLA